MVKGKFKVEKIVYKSEGFNIYGTTPIEMIEGEVEMNRYGNATIKTPMDLIQGHVYTLVLEEGHDSYGTYYTIISTAFDFKSLDEITPELHLDLLNELTSPHLAESINNAYPNFIQLVLSDRVGEIDVNNIKGVKHKLLAKFVGKVKKNCTMYMMMASYPDLSLTANECRALLNHYGTLEETKKEIDQNPYDTILTWTDRSFYALDKILRYNYQFDDKRLSWLVNTIIEHTNYDGSTYITTEQLVREVAKYDSEVVPNLVEVVEKSDQIVYNRDKDTLQRLVDYKHEKGVADFIKTKLGEHKPLDWDWEKFKKIKDGELTEEQQGALRMVCENTLSLLVGIAGGGKTSTVNAILQMLEHYDQSYILMAPTGRASQRLSEQTGRPAYTIHRATLPILNGSNPQGLTQDWIIIDEMSMVSLDIMDMVIEATNDITHTRFLFIGDSGQIPSIGLGAILRDCIESHKIPTTTLTHCFRFGEGGASYVAECMRQGKPYLPNDPQDYLTMGANEDYTFIKWDGTKEQIVQTYINAIDSGLRCEDVCLLVPYNKFQYGTIALNNSIQSIVNPISPKDRVMKSKVNGTPIIFHKGDMVLVTKNNYKAIKWQDYDEGLFNEEDMDDIRESASGTVYNGQVGVISDINGDGMVVRIEGESFLFEQEDLSNLRLGYALSVHKFQGSQAKYIINVIIPPHANMLSRELCYTAQTRFSKALIEIGTKESIDYAMGVTAQDNRKTRLKEFLLTND